MKKNKFHLLFLLIFVFFFFGAFKMSFFQDDFSGLVNGNATSINKFISFFSFINRDHFYRPLSSEMFYFFIQHLPLPLITGKIVVFAVFLLGIYFLYKTILLVSKNKVFSAFTIVLYSLHFSHVFQLYWFATFQEVLQFSFLSVSLYFLLKNRWGISAACFIGALLSKEQTVLFPVFAFFLYYRQYKKIPVQSLIFLSLSAIFGLISAYVNLHGPQVAEYAIRLSPRLVINNYTWYFLWSFGFPSMLPDYMRSIFSFPLPKFWILFAQKEFAIYFLSQLVFTLLLIIITLKVFISANRKERAKMAYVGIFSLLSFGLFLLPVLPIIHKWMVRLTIPLVFVSLFEAYIFTLLWHEKKWKWGTGFLLAIYFIWNFYGVKVHEVSSTYVQESQIVKNADKLFSDKKMKNCSVLYFKDPDVMEMSEWEGSKKLGLTFAGQSFISYYFPNKQMAAVYEYQTKIVPKNACVIKSEDLLK